MNTNIKKKLTRSLIAVGILATMTASAFAATVEAVRPTWIRRNPDIKSKKIGLLHEEDCADYMGKSIKDEKGRRWLKVYYNGKIGWVSSRYTIKY